MVQQTASGLLLLCAQAHVECLALGNVEKSMAVDLVAEVESYFARGQNIPLSLVQTIDRPLYPKGQVNKAWHLLGQLAAAVWGGAGVCANHVCRETPLHDHAHTRTHTAHSTQCFQVVSHRNTNGA